MSGRDRAAGERDGVEMELVGRLAPSEVRTHNSVPSGDHVELAQLAFQLAEIELGDRRRRADLEGRNVNGRCRESEPGARSTGST